MCIKAIANFDYEAAKDNLVETVKYLDAGKLLGVAGKLLEINPKEVAQKIKEAFYGVAESEEANKFAVIGALNLYLDFVNLFLYLLRLFGRRK